MEKTWIVVAESAQARIFEATNRVAPLREVASLIHPPSRSRTHDIVTDRPGHTRDRFGHAQRAMEEANAQQHEHEIFAREIAERLEKGRTTARFGDLVLIATPSFLGTLRRCLDDQTARLMSRTIDKNLVDKDEATIRSYLFG